MTNTKPGTLCERMPDPCLDKDRGPDPVLVKHNYSANPTVCKPLHARARDVQISTISTLKDVDTWTDQCPIDNIDISGLQSPDDLDAPGQYDWTPECGPVDTKAFCGRLHRILHHGTRCITVTFFCGRWDCERCGQVFHDQWVQHLVKVTENSDLYVLEIEDWAWVAVQKQIRRSNSQYVKVRHGDNTLTVITDKPIQRFSSLSGDHEVFFDRIIPISAPSHSKKPVTTSRQWQRHTDKLDSGWKQVTETWLPKAVQDKAAADAGFEVLRSGQWEAPKDMDQDKAQDELVKRIRWWETHIAYGIEANNQALTPETVSCTIRELISGRH